MLALPGNCQFCRVDTMLCNCLVVINGNICISLFSSFQVGVYYMYLCK